MHFILAWWVGVSFLLGGPNSFAETQDCESNPVDLLVLGDSQTGGSWATSYFGNFFQKCMSEHPSRMSFAVYARGGTQPIHWIQSAGLDHIPTVYRDATHPHTILGGAEVPVCKKRLESLLQIHRPKKVLLFFGDNLVLSTPEQIRQQYEFMLALVTQANISAENCYLLLPTYEMVVASSRHVPAKNLTNTLKVNSTVKAWVGNRCQVLDGLEVMKNSVLRINDKLNRVAVEGTKGCFGASADDNIHYCGEAAREFAQKTCDWIR